MSEDANGEPAGYTSDFIDVSRTKIEFRCGAAYRHVEAELRNADLVVTLIDDRRTLGETIVNTVKHRIPVHGTRLDVAPYPGEPLGVGPR